MATDDGCHSKTAFTRRSDVITGRRPGDTVTLRSPTTTPDDRLAVESLSQLAGLSLERFSRDLLYAKTSVEGMSASQLLQKDMKTFTVHGQRVCVAQLELYALEQVDAMMDDLREEMARYAAGADAALVVLMLTDINLGYSRLWFAGDAQPDVPHPCEVEGMLSRKKQMLPWLEHHLNPHR